MHKINIDRELLFQQYKLNVEMADRVSQRRADANKFYIALIGSLLTYVITILKEKTLTECVLLIFMFGVLGIALALIWYLNIKSYRSLNAAKFEVITQQEQLLPDQSFTKEWQFLDGIDGGSKKHITLTKVESYIPCILSIPFIWMVLYSLLYWVQILISYLSTSTK